VRGSGAAKMLLSPLFQVSVYSALRYRVIQIKGRNN
jgi:hypothetical protein